MSIRPPRPVRPVRNTQLYRELAIVGIVCFLLVSFGLRAVLSLIGIHSWTIAWRVIEIPTMLIVEPLERWSVMQHSIIGQLTIGETAAFGVMAVVALITLASLANQRR
jgi:hypothetical protein